MTFFRELWQRRQIEKAQNGDMSDWRMLQATLPKPSPQRLVSGQPDAITPYSVGAGLWAESHLRAHGLRRP